MNRNLKKVIGITTTAVAGMYIINRIVDYTAGQKNLLTTEEGNIYHWKMVTSSILFPVKELRLFWFMNWILLLPPKNGVRLYTVWKRNIPSTRSTCLAAVVLKNRVLPIPTSYMYSLINNFIHDIVKEAANIVVTGISSSFVIMAQAIEPDNFKKIILVNPSDINIIREMPTKENKCCQNYFRDSNYWYLYL